MWLVGVLNDNWLQNSSVSLAVCKVVFDLVIVLVNLVKSLMFLEGLFLRCL